MVAEAAVGSLAVDGGDRFSDLDITFGIADHVPVADVLNGLYERHAPIDARCSFRRGLDYLQEGK